MNPSNRKTPVEGRSSWTMNKTTTNAPTLPNNIILMILSRLCVKSLVRFKCVSASFHRVISSPEFQSTYYRSRSLRNPRFLFKLNDLDCRKLGVVSYFVMTDILGRLLLKFEVTLHDPVRIILPGCLGVVCLATSSRISLCNPSIHQCIQLPQLPREGPMTGIGFGYLGSINGFKVVELISRQSRDYVKPNIECWVLTLTRAGGGNTSWRLLNENCPYPVHAFSYPAFVNETIHWKIDRAAVGRGGNDFIVAFNIREENFLVISYPADWTYSADSHTHLVEIHEKLSMVEISGSSVNIWWLKDQENSIWSNQQRITTSHIDRMVVGELKLCARNGVFVFSSSENAILHYDLRQRTLLQVTLPFCASEFTAYCEGLYPLGS